MARKVARAIRTLAAAPILPLDGDVATIIPPSLPAFASHVPGTAFWIWYTATGAVWLTLRALTVGSPL